MSKIGRNAPCPCNSGKKYKHCHGQLTAEPQMNRVQELFDRLAAKERIRESQQGLGRPMVGVKFKEHQVVGVGNTVYFSKSWKTVPDFLADYIKMKLDSKWGDAEIAKPLEERHPLMQWYDAYCKYQQSVIKKPGEVNAYPITGVVLCYLGTAYALYLLDHNVELQARLIHRLKDPGQFQGAYYELIVASILIRAGFELTLEDETDGDSKHCEFAAVSKKTGKRYWVEAKMRAVRGLLGRTAADGGPDIKPLKQLIPHLNKALAKPAADERLVFIDLNAPPAIQEDGKPDWLEPAIKRLEQYEKGELKDGVTAYVVVTSMSAHRQLDVYPTTAGIPFGLGMADFNRPGIKGLSQAYREKQKHIDAYEIAKAFEQYAVFPTTFDGTLPSEAFGQPTNRVIIGESYDFGDGVIGKVTTASVSEATKEMLVGASLPDGGNIIVQLPMTETELEEYRMAPEAYFGVILPVGKHTNDPFEMFEWMMGANAKLSRQKMLDFFNAHPDRAQLEALNDEELRMAFCEAHVAFMVAKSGQPTQPQATTR